MSWVFFYLGGGGSLVKWNYKVGLIFMWWENPSILFEENFHFERALYSHLLSDLSIPCRAYTVLCGFPLRKYVWGASSCCSQENHKNMNIGSTLWGKRTHPLDAGERFFPFLIHLSQRTYWAHCIQDLLPTSSKPKVNFQMCYSFQFFNIL